VTSTTRRHNLPVRMRRQAAGRAARSPRVTTPAWRVGHYDGPTTYGGLVAMSKLAATGIVPPIYWRQPGACLSLLLKARALDIPIATAFENVWWNPAIGKGSITAQLMAALLGRHGYEFDVTEETDDRVAMVFHRRDPAGRRELGPVDWTILEAVGAGLTWRTAWQHHPKDMLWARCVMRGARRYASEVGTGLAYTPEELADMSEPAEGSEVHTAVLDILAQATAGDVTADFIRNDLVKLAKARKLLDLDTGDGQPLGAVLALLWGQVRAREADAHATPAPAGVQSVDDDGRLRSCGCRAEQVLLTGAHESGVCRVA
jgi:hypothetical protein